MPGFGHVPGRTPPLPDAVVLHQARWAELRAGFERELAVRPTPDTYAGLGDACWWLGDIRTSVACLRRAYVGYLRAGDRVRAAQVAMALSTTYKCCYGSQAAAVGWLARAARCASSQRSGALRGWLWLVESHLCADADVRRSVALARQALARARSHQDHDLELCALGQLGESLVRAGQVDDGLRLVDEAMAGVSAGECQRLDSTVVVCCTMLAACTVACDLARAAHWARVVDEFLASYGCPYLYADCRLLHGSMLLLQGDWAHAEAELLAVRRMTEDAYPALYAAATACLADLRARQGRLEDAAALLSPVAHEAAAWLPLASLRRAAGETHVAVALLERVLRHYDRGSLTAARALELLVYVRCQGGDIPAARQLLADLWAVAERHRGQEAEGRAHLAAGQVALAGADATAAVAAFERAQVVFTRLGFPLEAARARLGVAQSLQHANHTVAVQEAKAALSCFRDLGAGPDADAASRLLRSLGVADPSRPRGLGDLSPREAEVLQLLAAGLSNPEIAQRLWISRKTVSHHVSSVLTKLNLRNRAQAAAYAARTLRDESRIGAGTAGTPSTPP